MQVCHRAGPGEARIDMDQLGGPGLGLHHPLEARRMAFGRRSAGRVARFLQQAEDGS
jgi:hypothetical protein